MKAIICSSHGKNNLYQIIMNFGLLAILYKIKIKCALQRSIGVSEKNNKD